ncbi:MAG: hypothetical protein K0Q70_1485 [Rhodospirillales bacterium]|jgi:class 3 adenylate cyclase|nr:hypothetical protein [Rhodospirillales bacterium]
MSWHDIAEPTELDLLVGFYDLSGYQKLCTRLPARDILDAMIGYFDLTGRIIADANGILVKTMGDAGLVAFPAEEADRGVAACLRVKSDGEAWLARNGINSRATFKLHLGPVACGRVGAPGHAIFDVYGQTVNTAATLESNGFAMTPQVFRALNAETRKLFKKHTPPVTYIAVTEQH